MQFYKLYLDPTVRRQLTEYDALAIIEWDVIVAHDTRYVCHVFFCATVRLTNVIMECPASSNSSVCCYYCDTTAAAQKLSSDKHSSTYSSSMSGTSLAK